MLIPHLMLEMSSAHGEAVVQPKGHPLILRLVDHVSDQANA